MKFFLILTSLSMLAFKNFQPVTQGLEGYVFLKQGNQMPSPGHPISRGRGISTMLYVYYAATQQQVEGTMPEFTRVKTVLIAKVKSDSTGHYTIGLPPGKYSVFIDNKGSLFASETNNEGILNPVIINNGKVTTKNFTIGRNLVY